MWKWFKRKKQSAANTDDDIDYLVEIMPDTSKNLPPDSSPAGLATDRLVADKYATGPEGLLKRITVLAGGEH